MQDANIGGDVSPKRNRISMSGRELFAANSPILIDGNKINVISKWNSFILRKQHRKDFCIDAMLAMECSCFS